MYDNEIISNTVEDEEEYLDMRKVFTSPLPGQISFTEKSIIEMWLSEQRELLFENPQSPLFGCEQLCREIGGYWLKHGKHGHDCNDPQIITGRESLNHYLKNLVEHNSGAFRYWVPLDAD